VAKDGLFYMACLDLEATSSTLGGRERGPNSSIWWGEEYLWKGKSRYNYLKKE
jgi:hypothetical protein